MTSGTSALLDTLIRLGALNPIQSKSLAHRSHGKTMVHRGQEVHPTPVGLDMLVETTQVPRWPPQLLPKEIFPQSHLHRQKSLTSRPLFGPIVAHRHENHRMNTMTTMKTIFLPPSRSQWMMKYQIPQCWIQ